MNENNPAEHSFIETLIEIILANCEKDKFGVNELAQAVGMRSYSLRRKLSAVSKKSINQLIREVRLQKAMEMLQQEDVTASEVAYKVGFGSPAYFTKCFHDYFGYPPGEAKNRITNDLRGNSEILEKIMENGHEKHGQKKPLPKKILLITGIVLTIFIIYILVNNLSFQSFSILPGKHLKSADKSIVVMTMQNLNGDEENTHFAFGITENILNNLFKIKGIKVINTPVAYTENSDSLKKIARENNVRFILSGTVQQSGNNITIIPKLTDIAEYEVIWSNSYNKKLTDIFQVTSNLSQQVALKLQTVITNRERKQIEKVPTTNQEAHEYYLMGRYLMSTRAYRDENASKYISPFEKAVEADTNYAEAYTGLAYTYLILTLHHSYPGPEGFIKAKENVDHAFRLDPDLAEAHATLGLIYKFERKWEAARKELETALALNPNNALIHSAYAGLMNILRDTKAYKIHTLKALELTPFSRSLFISKANIFRNEGNYKDALNEINKCITLYPDNYSLYFALWNTYKEMGEEQKAVKALQKAYSIISLSEKKYADFVVESYKNKGVRCLEEFDRRVELYSETYPDYYHLWQTYRAGGENQKAIDILQEAFYLASLTDKVFADSLPEIYKNKGMKGVEQSHYEHCILTDVKASTLSSARYCIQIGDKEKTLYWLEKAYEWDVPGLPGINGDPGFDLVRNEPRFQALIDSMGLTPYQ